MDDIATLCRNVGMDTSESDQSHNSLVSTPVSSPSNRSDWQGSYQSTPQCITSISPRSSTPMAQESSPITPSLRRSPRFVLHPSPAASPKKKKICRRPPVRKAIIPVRLPIGSKAKRSSLSKRKQTVFNKAHELWTICGAEVLVVVRVSRKNSVAKTYYGGSESMVTEFETTGVSRGDQKCELYRLFDKVDSDEEDGPLVTGTLSGAEIPQYMKSCIPVRTPPLEFEPAPSTSRESPPSLDSPPHPTATSLPGRRSLSRLAPRKPVASTGGLVQDRRNKLKQKNVRGPKTPSTMTPAMTTPAVTTPAQTLMIPAPTMMNTAPDMMTPAQAMLSVNSNPTNVHKEKRVMGSTNNDITFCTGMWVAVAYYRNFHLGQVLGMKGENSAEIKFLEKKGNTFIWPQKDDVETVPVIYIFAKNAKVVLNTGRALNFTCENIAEVTQAFIQFKKEYKDIL